MKSRLLFGLAITALIVALAPSSFAQIQITVNNTSVSPGEIVTNRNAATSDTATKDNGILFSGSLLAASLLTDTGVRLTFPAAITSSATVPTGDAIRISGATGVFAAAAISTINYTAGTIDLALPTFNNAGGTSGSFRVVGIRIEAVGKTGAQTAAVGYTPGSSGSNNYLLSSSSVPIISAVGPGIGSMAIGARTGQVSNGTALIFSNQIAGNYADANASIVLAEGFASAWKSSTQASNSATALTNGTQIRLTVAGLPNGVTATLTPNPSTTLTFVQGAQAFTGTSTVSSVNRTWDVASSSLTAVESLQFDVVLTGTPTGALFVPANNITVTATIAPIGDALDASGTFNVTGTPTQTGGYPRFAAGDVGPTTIATVAIANTNLLIPYFAKGFGVYDFGIAISNTTADPFGTLNGGATPTDGAVVFTVYIRGVATPITLSTATLTAVQASGIVAGKVPAGGVFTGSLSQMLPATAPADAVGYIFISADFLGAHGIGYLIETSPSYHITSAAPVLVMDPPNSIARNATEKLHF